MRDRSWRHLVPATAAALALILVSCSEGRPHPPPTSPGSPPTSPGSPPDPPPVPSPLTTVRIEVVVPTEIEPGASAQLTARAVKSDGSIDDVSGQAAWTSGAASVLTITTTGMATAHARGEAIVSVRFDSKAATARIYVLPRGTFALKGTVLEQGYGVAGVAMAILSGSGEGLTTESAIGGSYAFYGVAGDVRLQLKKNGYSNAIHQVRVTNHMTWDMAIIGEHGGGGEYSGTYTPCRLPPTRRSRHSAGRIINSRWYDGEGQRPGVSGSSNSQ